MTRPRRRPWTRMCSRGELFLIVMNEYVFFFFFSFIVHQFKQFKQFYALLAAAFSRSIFSAYSAYQTAFQTSACSRWRSAASDLSSRSLSSFFRPFAARFFAAFKDEADCFVWEAFSGFVSAVSDTRADASPSSLAATTALFKLVIGVG